MHLYKVCVSSETGNMSGCAQKQCNCFFFSFLFGVFPLVGWLNDLDANLQVWKAGCVQKGGKQNQIIT